SPLLNELDFAKTVHRYGFHRGALDDRHRSTTHVDHAPRVLARGLLVYGAIRPELERGRRSEGHASRQVTDGTVMIGTCCRIVVVRRVPPLGFAASVVRGVVCIGNARRPNQLGNPVLAGRGAVETDKNRTVRAHRTQARLIQLDVDVALCLTELDAL